MYDYKSISNILLNCKRNPFVDYEFHFRDKDIEFKRLLYYLHDQLIISVCNRVNATDKNISLRYTGYNLTSISDFKKWLKCDNYLYPRMSYCFDLYTGKELKKAFDELYKMNLIEKGSFYASTIAVNYPIKDRILPVVYAWFSLISKLKKSKKIKNDIIESILKTPEMLRNKYETYTKDQLINIIINRQIKRYDLKKMHRESPLFQLIIKDLIDKKLPNALQTYLKYHNKNDDFFIEETYNQFFAKESKSNNMKFNDDLIEIKDDDEDDKIDIDIQVTKEELINAQPIKPKEKRKILSQELQKLKNNGILLPDKPKKKKNEIVDLLS